MKRYLLPLILILLLTFTLIGDCAWLAGWDYRIELAIGDYAGDIGASVIWFPVTVFLTSTQGEEVFTELTTDAEYLKVAFTKADGTTELYAEKELFAPYTSQYPPAQSDTYVKSTTKYSTNYWAYYATDSALPLTGDRFNNSWLAANLVTTNQRFHIDLGSTKIIKRIYYENAHKTGIETNTGIQNFTFWGSNNAAAFAELTYATDTNWTELTVAQNTFDQHIASDEADPKYITVTNVTAYRYYAFKFADNYGHASYMGVRRIELQESNAIYHVSRDGWTIDANTSIYMYYDKDHADNTTYIGVIGLAGRDGVRENVWNSEYKMVQHKNDETTSTITDSTSNNNDGTKKAANEPIEATGKVGQGQDFDGSNDDITIPNHASLNPSNLTLEACFKANTWPQNLIAIVSKVGNNTGYELLHTVDQGAETVSWVVYSGDWRYLNISYTLGNWVYMAGTLDSTAGRAVYKNGDQITTDAYTSFAATTQNLKIGEAPFYTGRFFDGIIDEIRISGVARSAAWIKGTYNSLWDMLLTYGSEETSPVGIIWNTKTITKWNNITITTPINTQ